MHVAGRVGPSTAKLPLEMVQSANEARNANGRVRWAVELVQRLEVGLVQTEAGLVQTEVGLVQTEVVRPLDQLRAMELAYGRAAHVQRWH